MMDIWAFLQVLARVASLVAIAPVFGAKQTPNMVKVGLAFVLSIVITPIAMPSLRAAGMPTTVYGMVAPLAGHVIVGLMMGFVASLVILAVELGGSLLDTQVGFSMAQTFNPALGELAAPLTQFQSMYALLLFLLAHGHYIVIAAVANSFAILPALDINFGTGSFLTMVGDLTFGVLVNGLKIAAPAGAILLVIDFTLALLARAVPQMNVFYVGMPLKVIAGLTLVAAILPLFAIFVGHMVADMPSDLTRMMEGLRHT
jgi:flagellar biosynthetic protein FliR